MTKITRKYIKQTEIENYFIDPPAAESLINRSVCKILQLVDGYYYMTTHKHKKFKIERMTRVAANSFILEASAKKFDNPLK